MVVADGTFSLIGVIDGDFVEPALGLGKLELLGLVLLAVDEGALPVGAGAVPCGGFMGEAETLGSGVASLASFDVPLFAAGECE